MLDLLNIFFILFYFNVEQIIFFTICLKTAYLFLIVSLVYSTYSGIGTRL